MTWDDRGGREREREGKGREREKMGNGPKGVMLDKEEEPRLAKLRPD
jgi:hypothetical protein